MSWVVQHSWWRGTLCSSFQSCSLSTQTASARKQPKSTPSPARGGDQSLRLATCSHHQPASSWLLSISISSAQAWGPLRFSLCPEHQQGDVSQNQGAELVSVCVPCPQLTPPGSHLPSLPGWGGQGHHSDHRGSPGHGYGLASCCHAQRFITKLPLLFLWEKLSACF